MSADTVVIGLVLGFAFVACLRATSDAYARFILRCCDWLERHGL